MQRYNRYKTNLEGVTLFSINRPIRLSISLLGGPTDPALRLIPGPILGLILDLGLPSQLVLYIYFIKT